VHGTQPQNKLLSVHIRPFSLLGGPTGMCQLTLASRSRPPRQRVASLPPSSRPSTLSSAGESEAIGTLSPGDAAIARSRSPVPLSLPYAPLARASRLHWHRPKKAPSCWCELLALSRVTNLMTKRMRRWGTPRIHKMGCRL
jgi:hypothetical protein